MSILNLHGEKNLSYYTPGLINSNNYTRSTNIVYPVRSKTYFSVGDNVQIDFGTSNQSEFIIPSSARLQFNASLISTGIAENFVAVPPIPSDFDTVPPIDPVSGREASLSQFSSFFPGAFHFFNNITLDVPGPIKQSTTIPGMNTEIVNNHLLMARLLCGDDQVGEDVAGRPWNFSGTGDSKLCGLSCSRVRSRAVSGLVSTLTNGHPTDAQLCRFASAGLNYSIPMSAISHLFNHSSGYIPMSYLTNASQSCSLSLNIGKLSNSAYMKAGVNPDKCELRLSEFRIVFDTITVNEGSLLVYLKQMFTGQAIESIPLMPGKSLNFRIPMCLTQRGYQLTSASVLPNQTRFRADISCSLPAVEGILMKLCPRNVNPATSANNLHYLIGAGQTSLNKFKITVGRNSLPHNQPFEGGHTVTYVDTSNNQQASVWSNSIDSAYFNEFQKARHLFGLFGDNQASSSKSMIASYAFTTPPIAPSLSALYETKGDYASLQTANFLSNYYGSLNVFAFSLETLPLNPGFTEYDDNVIRGLNLNALSNITVEGDVTELAHTPNQTSILSPLPYQEGVDIHFLLAHRRAYFLLSGAPMLNAMNSIVNAELTSV